MGFKGFPYLLIMFVATLILGGGYVLGLTVGIGSRGIEVEGLPITHKQVRHNLECERELEWVRVEEC